MVYANETVVNQYTQQALQLRQQTLRILVEALIDSAVHLFDTAITSFYIPKTV